MSSPKIKVVFYCKECGNEYSKWQGKCTHCGTWNALVEKKILPFPTDKSSVSVLPQTEVYPQRLTEIHTEESHRLAFQDAEFMRVMGGGVMRGSISLIAGEPGIGKSTLLLQLGLQEKQKKTLYVCGEESPQQIKERAKRIHSSPNDQFYLLAENSVERIIQHILDLKPDWVIIDSIQTVHSEQVEGSQGSMSQLRESTILLQACAKRSGISLLLIGHINKEGAIAGPKILEHMVDTVVLFEGEKHYNYRMLRCTKNRFGNTSELGIYEMTEKGMQPVKNPNELLLSTSGKRQSGTSIGSINEGLRTFFVEVQALVTPTYYATPQRTASGIEQRKLQLICAVLEKICKLQLGNKDIFITLVAGMKTNDPAIDLAIAIAIVSSYLDIPIPSNFCFSGELSLSGEIRSVTKIDQRIKEASKTGFHTFVCSAYNFKHPIKNDKTRIYLVKELSELIDLLKSNH